MANVEERSDDGDLVDRYVDSLRDAGMYVGRPVVSVARSFFQRVGPPDGQQCLWKSAATCDPHVS